MLRDLRANRHESRDGTLVSHLHGALTVKFRGGFNHDAAKGVPQTLPRAHGHMEEWLGAAMKVKGAPDAESLINPKPRKGWG